MQNLCVLATDSTITQSYLTVLKEQNNLPDEIIYLKIRRNSPFSIKFYKKLVKQKLLNFQKALNVLGQVHINEELYTQIKKYCKKKSLTIPDYKISVPKLLKGYNINYKSLTVKSINDSNLVSYIDSKVESEFVLFCGGGILRKPLFDTGKKFIHIHPGLVPEIKGSDGILWSTLVRGKIGMSAFFMNEGIDTGDIIMKKEYELPKFHLDFDEKDSVLISNKIIRYLDPVYRADILRKLISHKKGLSYEKAKKQDPKVGKTYYFMHPYLKQQAVNKFIAN